MPDELKVWAPGDGAEVDVVESVTVGLEDRLEETLVRRPEMIEPGLYLVGRQTPTEGSPLDLLGVDKDGRLVVFELKRERLTREAVTQCIDYTSTSRGGNRSLSSLSPKRSRYHSSKLSISSTPPLPECFAMRSASCSRVLASNAEAWDLAWMHGRSGWRGSSRTAASTSPC